MKTIPLSKGKFAQVDDSDFDMLSKFKWFAYDIGNSTYAARSVLKDGKRTSIYMHRVILELSDTSVYCDHIDGDGLNNTRNNLREATPMQNQRNSKSRKNSSSKFIGVSWDGSRDKWQANICVNKRLLYLGRFQDEVEAASRYNIAANMYFGEFARLNLL